MGRSLALLKMSSESFNVSHHVEVLRGLEDEVAAALKNSSFKELMQDLQKRQVEVAVNVETLDEGSLSPGVLSRYLIQLLTSALATGGEKVWSVMVASLDNLDKAITVKCSELLEGLKPIANLPKVADKVGFLVQDDIPLLTRFVLEEDIDLTKLCAGLKLPISEEAAEMEECTENGSCSEKVGQALGEWVAGNHEAAPPASFQNFKLVLDSNGEEVGEALNEALLVLETNLTAERVKNSAFAEIPEEKQLEIVGQSPNTEVHQGKSTILEVCMSTSSNSDVFQWQRNGQLVVKDEGYDDVTRPLLFVRVSDQTEGEYRCHVRRGKEEVSSRKIQLTAISTSQQDEFLVSLYSDLEKQLADHWPSVSNCRFSNLVQLENILEKISRVVDYEDVFEEIPNGELIFVKGTSGAGKTMLAYRLATDWSEGKILRGINQVFLLTPSVLSSNKFHHLSDILKLFYRDQTKQNVCLGEIERAFGRNVCFLFDGLDNEQLQDGRASLVLKILQKSYLPESVVIATSASMTEELSTPPLNASQLLELEKFTESEQIFQFVYSFPFSTSDSDFEEDAADPAKLVEYIYSKRTVLDVCSLPVHTAMACLVHKYNDTLHFSTLTELYRQFSQTVDFGKLQRNSVSELNSKSLMGRRNYIFQQICKAAFDATVGGHRSFSEKDTGMSFSVASSQSSSVINVVCQDGLSNVLGLEETNVFLCQLLQNFLTAFHVAELSSEDQTKAIEQLGYKKETEMVWKFLFGLSQDNEVLVTLAETIPPRAGLFEIHCAFESQQADICERIVRGVTLDFSYEALTPYDLNALRFVACSILRPFEKMCFSHCELGDRTLIEVLSLIPNEKWKSLEDLDLSVNHIGSLGATALADRLKHMFQDSPASPSSSQPTCNFLNLRELNLSHNNLGSDGTITLVHELRASLPQLRVLNLSHNAIGSGGAAVATKDMAKLQSLQDLNLSHNNISSEMAVVVVRNFLGAHHKIRVLHLEGSDIVGSDIAQELHEHKNNLEVHLGPSTIIRCSLHPYQTCCVLS